MLTYILLLFVSSAHAGDFTPEQDVIADRFCEINTNILNVVKLQESQQKAEAASGVKDLYQSRKLGEEFAGYVDQGIELMKGWKGPDFSCDFPAADQEKLTRAIKGYATKLKGGK